VGLVPRGVHLDGVSVVDRRPSLSNPPWDVPGSRYAQADLRLPAASDPASAQRAIGRRARASGWTEAGATSGGARRYERDAMQATIELSDLGPSASEVEVAIRVRPHSKRPQLGLAIGFAAGLLVVVLAAVVAGRVRPPQP
jgi:hypothetical protein